METLSKRISLFEGLITLIQVAKETSNLSPDECSYNDLKSSLKLDLKLLHFSQNTFLNGLILQLQTNPLLQNLAILIGSSQLLKQHTVC